MDYHLSLARKTEGLQQKYQYIRSINDAHESGLLFYAREKNSRDLARIIRPEFARLYVVNEFRDALRLIEKNNHHGEPDVTSSKTIGIDMIIADADYTTPKLLEYLQKRAEDPKTGHRQVISVTLLIPENIDNQLRSIFAHSDFCSDCINCPFTVTSVLDRVLEVLHRRKVIETTYKAIRKKTKSKEYPFVPIFADRENDTEDQDFSNELAPKKAAPATATTSNKSVEGLKKNAWNGGNTLSSEYENEEEEGGSKAEGQVLRRNSTSSKLLDFSKLEDDEWLEFDGLVPAFIEQLRESIHPVLGKQTTSELCSNVSKERRRRRLADKRIARIICDESESSRTQRQLKRQLRHAIETSVIEDGHEMSDIEAFSHAGSDSSDNEDGDALQAASSENLSIALNDTMKHLAGVILSNKMRSIRDEDQKTHSKAVDIRPFITRAPPIISEAKTVLGHNKRVADGCWRVIHDRNAIDGPTPDLDKGRTSGSIRKLKSLSSHQIQSPGLPSVSSPTSGNAIKRISLLATQSLLSVKPDVSPGMQQALLEDSSESISSAGASRWPCARTVVKPSPLREENQVPKRISHRWSSVLHLVNEDSKAGIPPSKEKAVKLVKKMASEVPVEGSIYKLMSLDVASRKISAGEWVYLAQGLRRKEEGDFAKAITSFTRAIRRSKQPQLPMIFKAGIHFEQRNYLAALNEFTAVIKLLHDMAEAQYNIDDDFLARYNRGIVNFCLGDDANGIADFRSALALDLDPTLHGREILLVHSNLATALRRLGHFDESINELLTCKKIESELQLDVSESPNGQSSISSNPTTADGEGRDVNSPFQSAPLTSRSQSASELAFNVSRKKEGTRQATPTSRRNMSKAIGKESVVVELTSPISISVKERRVLFMQQQQLHKRDGSSQQLGNLDTFKTINGIKRDLFDTLFVKPSLVQEALLCQGLFRTSAQLESIRSVLRGCEFFKSIPTGALDEISRTVEYRTLSSKGRLFTQGQPVDSICFVLSGQVQIKLDIIHESIVQSEVIGEVSENEVFGHFDALFENPESFVQNFLNEGRSDKSKGSSIAETDVTLANSLESLSASVLAPKEDNSNSGPSMIPASLPKALQPGSFMSFNVDVPTELIHIPLDAFKRWLVPVVSTMFQERLRVLQGCGIFATLPLFDIVRLARSCTTERYRAGEVILKQGTKPNFLYIVTAGLCRVLKAPSRVDGIVRKLTALRQQQQTFDTKYVFHHMLRDQIHHANTNEVEKCKLAAEIERLEELLVRARQVEAKDFDAARSSNSSPVKKEIEISVLHNGKIFGEACVLHPENGVALGSIVADTVCEVLSLHQLYLQTIRITDSIISRLKDRAIVYPDDDALIADNESLQAWHVYKHSLLDKLYKEKARALSPKKSKIAQSKK